MNRQVSGAEKRCLLKIITVIKSGNDPALLSGPCYRASVGLGTARTWARLDGPFILGAVVLVLPFLSREDSDPGSGSLAGG